MVHIGLWSFLKGIERVYEKLAVMVNTRYIKVILSHKENTANNTLNQAMLGKPAFRQGQGRWQTLNN